MKLVGGVIFIFALTGSFSARNQVFLLRTLQQQRTLPHPCSGRWVAQRVLQNSLVHLCETFFSSFLSMKQVKSSEENLSSVQLSVSVWPTPKMLACFSGQKKASQFTHFPFLLGGKVFWLGRNAYDLAKMPSTQVQTL